MRQRFEQQLNLGQTPISEVEISKKVKTPMVSLLAALQHLFLTPEYNEKIFRILEEHILKGLKKTGRKGMDLWQLFVLAQARLCINASYAHIHYLANYDELLRQIMGVSTGFGIERIEFDYQTIYDNVSLLDDEVIQKINEVIFQMGHDVFKKKEEELLVLKTDSYVVESNVHFPTDYNLLWDSGRKCLDMISHLLKRHPEIEGWRKKKDWYRRLKGQMRELGKVTAVGGKNKEERVLKAANQYIKTSKQLSKKVQSFLEISPTEEALDWCSIVSLMYFLEMLDKHIDLVERRLIKGETIPHEEKLFSIFETYTEMIKKGKQRPNFELGKKVLITTDQYHLIVDYQIMNQESDSEVVINLADRLLVNHQVKSWSWDKGFYSKDNKELLQLEVPEVIMPKKGKRNKTEENEESTNRFIKLKNAHSAIESNINELEHRGLDRCPDKGYNNFKRYISLGITAYNLHKIGKELISQKLAKEKKLKVAA